MIDSQSEHIITFSQAADDFPSAETRPENTCLDSVRWSSTSGKGVPSRPRQCTETDLRAGYEVPSHVNSGTDGP